MAQNNSEEEFNELVTAFFQGRMTRRRFIHRAAQLGLSAALVSQIVPASFAAGDDFLESSPVAPNESPVTKERIEYLKSMPYKDTTINVMVLRSAVGDCVEYHAPRWEEETGAHVNITKVPIDTLHQEIFGDLKGAGKYDAYQTAAWYYGDFFTSEEPTIVEIAPFLKDPKYPYWDPDQFLPAMKRLYTWQGKLYGCCSMRMPRFCTIEKMCWEMPATRRSLKANLDMIYPIPPKQ